MTPLIPSLDWPGWLQQTVFVRSPASPSAGPTIRGTPTTGSAGNPTLPAHAAGDTLLVGAVYAGGATPTATGWTRIVAQNDGAAGDYRLVVFKKEGAPGSDTSLSPSANPVSAWVAVAVKDSSAVDALTVSAGGGFGTTITCPSVTIVAPPVLIHDFALAYEGDSLAPAVTAPAGSTQVAHVQDGANLLTLSLATLAVAAAGATGTRAASASVAVSNAVGSVAVK